jgi:hypothetical protein
MNPIDPREFGRLEAEVKSLSDQVDSMQRDIKALLALANKGKGGFWMGMTMASFVGGFISWIASHASWFK